MMKLLIDSSMSIGVVPVLQAAGHDVAAISDLWPEDPGDDVILARAHAEGRIVVTRDKDFGEPAVLQDQPHTGILRLWDTPARLQAAVVEAVLNQHGTDLQAGAIVTASPYRVRIRQPLPPPEAES